MNVGRSMGVIAFASLSALAACTVDFRRHYLASEEDCENGVDDDDDAKIDCADEACDGAICAPAAPDSWLGPVVVVLGADPKCPGGAPPSEVGTLCSACACEGEVACATATVAFGDPGCPASPSESASVGTGDCVEVNISGGLASALGMTPAASPTCGSVGGGLSAAALCEFSGGDGCAGSARCAHAGSVVCVHRPGEWPCPEPYSTRSQFATGGVTSCTACACEADADACAGTTTLFLGDGCTGQSQPVEHDGATCTTLTDTPQSARYEGPVAGGCTPAGGFPEGTPTTQTVCCLP